MVRVATAAGKGGVSKTTCAVGLASVLASMGRRVLVVDCDPQSDACWALGGDVQRPGVSALLHGEAPAIQPVTLNLAVLAGGPELRSAGVERLDPEALRDALDTIEGWDDVVIDAPPGAERLETFATTAADCVLVCVDAHPFGVSGADRVISGLEGRRRRGRPGAHRWALLMTRRDLRRTMDRELEAVLARNWPEVPRLSLRQDSALAQATADRVLIADAAPHGRGTEDLRTIAAWVLGIDHG